jgi:hypothetical protein
MNQQILNSVVSQKWNSLWFSVTKERSKEKQMQKQQNVSNRGKENQMIKENAKPYR